MIEIILQGKIVFLCVYVNYTHRANFSKQATENIARFRGRYYFRALNNIGRMVSRRLRYTWWAAPRSQVGPPTFQGTSREALCVHLCRLRGVVFSPGSSTYNREQEGSAAAILSRVPCPPRPLLEPNRFFASCFSLLFPSLYVCQRNKWWKEIRRKKIRCVEREWCEERMLIFSLAGTEVY